MQRSFLMVLPNEIRSAVAPLARAISTSTTEAVSKQEPHLGKQTQDFRRRIRLYGVEDAGIGQCTSEGGEVVAHDIEVEHHHRAFVLAHVTASAQKIADTIGHGRSNPQVRERPFVGRAIEIGTAMSRPASGGDADAIRDVLWRHVVDRGRISHPEAAVDWKGDPHRTPGKRETSLFGAGLWKGRRDQKSPFVVALSCVPPWRAGFAGFRLRLPVVVGVRCCHLDAGRRESTLSTIDPLRPLAAVRQLAGCPPTDTRPTGTCEIGQGAYTFDASPRQGKTGFLSSETPTLPPQCDPKSAPVSVGPFQGVTNGSLSRRFPC